MKYKRSFFILLLLVFVITSVVTYNWLKADETRKQSLIWVSSFRNLSSPSDVTSMKFSQDGTYWEINNSNEIDGRWEVNKSWDTVDIYPNVSGIDHFHLYKQYKCQDNRCYSVIDNTGKIFVKVLTW